jgi:hypothetical protein
MLFRRRFGMPFSIHPLLRLRRTQAASVGLLYTALIFSLLSAPAWAKPGGEFSLRPVQKTTSVPGKDLTVNRSVMRSPSQRHAGIRRGRSPGRPPGRRTSCCPAPRAP